MTPADLSSRWIFVLVGWWSRQPQILPSRVAVAPGRLRPRGSQAPRTRMPLLMYQMERFPWLHLSHKRQGGAEHQLDLIAQHQAPP